MVLCVLCVYEAEQCYYYAVDGKVYELAFLYNINHPFASKTARNKCCQEANNERNGRNVAHDVFATYHLDDVEQCLAQDGGYDHKE